jgi:hypothetical protein
MIAPSTLLNITFTPRTLLATSLNQPPTQLFLIRLQRPVRPVFVLVARFSLVPLDSVLHTMTSPARGAAELWFRWVVDLACFAIYGAAPCEVWQGV